MNKRGKGDAGEKQIMVSGIVTDRSQSVRKIVTDFGRSVKITDTSGFLTDRSESVTMINDGL